MLARAHSVSQRWSVAALCFAAALCGSATTVSAQPAFSKSFNPDIMGPGSTSTLVFVIDNSFAATPADDLEFTDVLPAGVVVASPSGRSTTCINGNLSAPDGGSTIAFTNGRLGTFSTCAISVNVTSSTGGVYDNVSGDLTSTAGNSGNAVGTLTVDTARPGFTASFAPNPIPFGATSTLTWTIDNSQSTSAVLWVAFADTLPLGMRVASPANTFSDCGSSVLPPTITAASGTRAVSVLAPGNASFPVLAANGTCTVSVDVVGEAAGELHTLSGELFADQFQSINCGKATTTLSVERKELNKLFVDDPVPAGGTVLLEYTLTNFNRTDAAADITFTDDLGAALVGLAAVGLPLAEPCGPGSQLTGTTSLAFSGGQVAAAASCTFSVTLQVPANATSGVYSSTTSDVDYVIGGQPRSWEAASDRLVVQPVPFLTAEFIGDPVGPGGDVLVRFTIENTSAVSDATNIEFTDELTTFLPFPVNVTLPPVPDPPCGASSSLALVGFGTDRQGLSLFGGSLAAAGTCTFEVGLHIPVGVAGNTYTNVTSAITASIDGVTVVGQPASDSFDVAFAPRLHKEFTDDPATPGGTVSLRYTLSHRDLATADATGITFTDNFDAALAGLAAIGLPLLDLCGAGNGTLTGSAADTLLTFSGATLSPGETCIVDVALQVPGSAPPGAHLSVTSNVTATVDGVAVEALGASDDLQIAGVTLTKEFIDDPATPGGTTTLQFTLHNDHPTELATSIQFSDNLNDVLPGTPDLVAVLPPVPDPPCGPSSSLAGSPGFLLLSGGELAAGASCTFEVTVDIPVVDAGDYLNVTSSVSSSLGISAPATDTLLIADPLMLTKSFIDDPVAPGGTVTLELTIANADATQAATGVSFSDDLDAVIPGLAAVDLPVADPCGAGSMVSDGGGGVILLTGGSIAADDSCTFQVTLSVPVSVPVGGTFTNVTSPVSGTFGGNVLQGDPAIAELEVAWLRFDKAFDGAVFAGGSAILTFTIENLDASSVGLISFADDLDAMLPGAVAVGLPVTDACGPGSVLDGTNVVSLRNGSLGSAQTCSFPVTVAVPAAATPGVYPNVTTDLSIAGQPLALPASDSLQVEPVPILSKAFSPADAGVGLPSTLTLTVDNTAASVAWSGLGLVDSMPAGMTAFTPPNASSTCGGTLTAEADSSTITWSGGTVAAGGTCTIQVDVSSDTVGNHVNTTGALDVAGDVTAPASATLSVGPPPVLTKQFVPDTLFVGQASVLTLTIDNSSSSAAAAGLAITDPLPAGVTVASPANASTTCTGGTLVATPGGGELSYTGGSVSAAASCAIQVDVTSAAVGSYTNTTGELASALGSGSSASDTLSVEALPGFAKAFTPEVVLSGGTSTLTFTIDNSASSLAVTALAFGDALPVGMVVATPPNASTTCGGASTAAAGASAVSFADGSVAAGASCVVQVDVASTAVGANDNTAEDLTSSAGNSGPASATLTVNPVTTTPPGGGSPDNEGCSCSSAGGGSGATWLLLTLVVVVRRRTRGR